MIKDRLIGYLEKQEFVSNWQHGFVKHKSCVRNLLETMDIVTKSFAEGLEVDVV